MMTRVISIEAIATVIKRHKLKPHGGGFHLTDEMMAEAAALDGMDEGEVLESLKKDQSALAIDCPLGTPGAVPWDALGKKSN
jgi:hypothetical protein